MDESRQVYVIGVARPGLPPPLNYAAGGCTR